MTKKLADAILLRAVRPAIGRRPRAGDGSSACRRRVREPLAAAVEPGLEQLDVRADLGRVEDRAAVGRPDRRVAAAAVEVGDVEELDHAPVAAAIGQLPQARAVGPDDVRMAVVMFAGEEEHPLAVGRPRRGEVERLTGLDLHGVRAVGVGQEDLIALVVGDPPAVPRAAEAVGELLRLSW